jgi:hypothetical protein
MQTQPPQQVSQVVGQDAQGQPHLIRHEAVAGEPGPVRGILALLDPFAPPSLVRCRSAPRSQVADEGLPQRSPHRTLHEVSDLPFQHIIAGEPDGVDAAVLLQIPVELRAGKGRIPPEVLANPSLLRFPPINPRFRLVILPVAVFLLVRRVATPEIAIGAGFFTSLIVFFVNRQIGRIGIPAVLGMVIVAVLPSLG